MSRSIMIDGKTVPLDADGYLQSLSDWNQSVAYALALEENIHLTEHHWEVVHLLRDFYRRYSVSPAMRPLCKYISQELNPEKGRSIYLLSLFPGSPAKIAAKIAGLPRPANCF